MANQIISENVVDTDGQLYCGECSSSACQHVREAITEGYDRGTLADYEIGDLIYVPIFMVPKRTAIIEDEAIVAKFDVIGKDADTGALELQAQSYSRGPTIHALLLPGDGRVALRDEVIEWAISQARADWRACMADYHDERKTQRRVLEDKLESIGFTNKTYITETVCLWAYDRCTDCLSRVNDALIPSL